MFARKERRDLNVGRGSTAKSHVVSRYCVHCRWPIIGEEM
jgi:hypothetical protein